MSERHAFPSRLGYIYREIAKFGVVGLAGVVVNVLAFNVIRHGLGLQTVRASVIATLVAIGFNYIGLRYFTYRDRGAGGHTRELPLFLLFSLVGLVIENSVLYAATYGFGWDSQLQSNFFKFVGIGVATVFRFWSYRTWVFKALPAGSAAAEAESVLAEADRQPAAQEARTSTLRT
ncbi:membrane protein [Planotetraspora thailandica]|uniref:Membrane protein n=1 Tax=Planotetraspora thailandica TaxID=487172 RepID=A0A8J4DEN9_9ACTN|nr:GtrA family protein [Planotetraspora thailandica]GII59026.1 membrane protein [Planotetraspora thailandica]